MLTSYLKSKLHGIQVTQADLYYEGSIALDTALMDQAGIAPYEQVDVYNIHNGERFTTYAIAGGKNVVCVNGAAARKVQVGDALIVVSYCLLTQPEALTFKPRVVIAKDFVPKITGGLKS